MRKGLTLIELIFTMVIVAVTFTVIPKLIQSMKTGASATIKEDAIYNTMVQMSAISYLPWDQNNTTSDAILHVRSGEARYDCDGTTHRRVGGFVGSRDCVGGGEIDSEHNASLVLGKEDSYFDDVDDFNGYSVGTQAPCGDNLYDLQVVVEYVRDSDIKDNSPASSTNVKHVTVETKYDENFRNNDNTCIFFDYYSYNIGQIAIKKRRWE